MESEFPQGGQPPETPGTTLPPRSDPEPLIANESPPPSPPSRDRTRRSKENLARRGKKEREYSSASSESTDPDSDDSTWNTPRVNKNRIREPSTVRDSFSYRTPTHVIRRLYEERQQYSQDCNPPVIWEARIYRARHGKQSSRDEPRAIYYDDRPLEYKLQPLSGDSELMNSDKKNVGEQQNHVSWTGAVFEVCFRALEHPLPRSIYVHHPRSDAAKPSGNTGKANPPAKENADSSLVFNRVSEMGIRIKSPFLYCILSEIVGYYPSFYMELPAANLLKLFLKRGSEVNSNFAIYEPYAVLMHHFLEIEATANNIQPRQKMDQESEGEQDDPQVSRLKIEHLKRLYDFLNPQYQAQILPLQEQLKTTAPRIAFDMLWWIYRPGTTVYYRTPRVVYACVISNIRSNLDDRDYRDYDGVQATENIVNLWVLDLWYLDSDGVKIGRSPATSRIEAYTGLREITSLDICPIAVWDAFDKGERRKTIMRRSSHLFKALQQGFLLARHDGPGFNSSRYYAGPVVIDHRRGISSTQSQPPSIGRVRDFCPQFCGYDGIIVNESTNLNDDPGINTELFSENLPGRQQALLANEPRRSSSREAFHGTRGSEPAVLSEYTNVNANTLNVGHEGKEYVKELDDHQLLLLSPIAWAFALKTKQWLMIQADYVSEIVQSEDSIDNLVLGEDDLKTICRLAKRQNNIQESWAADFIEGKGTGQIILLHGPPGVGKTYTVEAIAEWLHRPLLALSITDIGTIETRVESELLKWFSLAEAWNAVLLVDEADIFLERRQNRDLARNGLVSAFLRRMEYLKNLLFLTTNRVGQIDDAFISRVHVAIGYKALSGEDRKRIWNGFFRKLTRERPGKIQIAPGAKNWVLEMALNGTAQLNGRDIRNALQTAITLAETECEEDPDFDPSTMAIIVDKSHFQRVLDINHKFYEYVKSIRREDERKRAAVRFDRND
ncbi:hypothetical protein ARAM_004743 [Aspergillus rambellii]|uniref:AAA+ ATPase domain-containing protein n=1 Tax=Aspergillus rambellii TaxID=308745 RepID=A0A0F8UA13_9EURO|nr:hypothetical protein ARAM_004743 [Aspergillus rambellii]